MPVPACAFCVITACPIAAAAREAASDVTAVILEPARSVTVIISARNCFLFIIRTSYYDPSIFMFFYMICLFEIYCRELLPTRDPGLFFLP
jgi:hypothetical protein